MHGLSVSKNDVALDILVSRDCLASLCKLLDTDAARNSGEDEDLVVNAIDCIWSIVGAQSPISKMTSCHTLLTLNITQRMLHAMAAIVRLSTARRTSPTPDEHKALSHGIEALLTLASVYSPPFRKSMCTPETIDGKQPTNQPRHASKPPAEMHALWNKQPLSSFWSSRGRSWTRHTPCAC